MPEVVVYLLEGRTLEQKRGLVKDITAAVVKNAAVPPERRRRWRSRSSRCQRPPRARVACCSARCRRASHRYANRARIEHGELRPPSELLNLL